MENNIAKFMLPIKDTNSADYGYSDINYLVELGASVKETHYERYNKHFITIILPKGYSIGEETIVNSFKQKEIVDELGNARGSFFVKMDDLSVAGLHMLCKYSVMATRYTIGENKFCKVYFGDAEEELFEEGVISLNERDRSPLYIQSQLAILRSNCEERALELYPDYKSPLAYWSKEKVKVLTKKTED